jgi:hypothetical protein
MAVSTASDEDFLSLDTFKCTVAGERELTDVFCFESVAAGLEIRLLVGIQT